MLIDQYADMYRQATSGAGKGAKYADPRLWISMRFLADEGVKPWEPELAMHAEEDAGRVLEKLQKM